MNRRSVVFFMMIPCVLSLVLSASPAYCVDASNIKPILWRTNDYGSVSPLNFTVAYVQSVDLTVSQKDEIKEVINHWAVGMYEMTNAMHQLGSIKVVRVSDDIKENFHVLWRDTFHAKYLHGDIINAGLGSYVPYAQNGRLYGSILFDWKNIGVDRPNYYVTGQQNNTLRYGGYTLAHECGHLVYSLRDEYFMRKSTLRTNADMAIMNMHVIAIFDPAQTVDGNGNSVTHPGSPKWLNFSTNYNYHGTAYSSMQWGMYGMSAWDAVINPDAEILAVTSPGLLNVAGFFYRKYWFEDLENAKPQGTGFDLSREDEWYQIEYTNGLPPQGATDFDPPGNAQKSENEKFRLPSVEFGPSTRARVIIFDNTPATKPIYNIEGKQVVMQYNKALISNIVLHITEFYDKNDDGFNHVGVYAYDSNGVKEIVPIQEITDQSITSVIEDVWEKGCGAGDSVLPEDSNVPVDREKILDGIIDMLSEGKSDLLAYMKNNDIVLGDIYVISGGLYTDDLLSKLETLRTASRSSFIPVHVKTFGLVGNTSDDRKLAVNTGGTFERSLVPNEPLSFDLVDGYAYLKTTSRDMSITPYPTNKKINDFDFYIRGTASKGMARTSSRSFPVRSYRSPYAESGELEQDAARWLSSTKSYLQSVKFKVNDDVKQLSLLLMSASSNPDFDLKLTAPGNVSVQCDKIINIPDSQRGGIFSFHADISQVSSKNGDWELELKNNAQGDCGVAAFIYGDAGTIDNSYFNDSALNAAPMGIFNKAEDGESTVVRAAALRGGEPYTGITQELTVCKPDGEAYSISLNDDGEGEDAFPGDGIYTGRIDVGMTGLYILKNRAFNENGTARRAGGIAPVALPAESYFEIKSETELFVVDEHKSVGENVPSSPQSEDGDFGGGCNIGNLVLMLLLVSMMIPILKRSAANK